MAVIDLKNVLIKIKDGSGKYIDVRIGEGNLTWTETRNMTYFRDRGLLNTVREGDQEPVDVTLDAIWEFIKSPLSPVGSGPDGIVTIIDALKKTGSAIAWVSTSADLCEPYAVDIELEHTPICGGVAKEVITLADFRHESIDYDLRAGTFSIAGKCNITQAAVVRV